MSRTLCIDIGGTSIKAAVFDASGHELRSARRRTPYPCPPERLLDRLTQVARALGPYERVAIGFPGLVRDGRVRHVPAFTRSSYAGPTSPALQAAWQDFPLTAAAATSLQAPVRLANDADLHGAAVIRGQGLEFVMTLGTGVGTAVFLDGVALPHLELSHASFEDGRTFDDALGNARRREMGDHAWAEAVLRAIPAFERVLYFDACLIGGGNAALLDPASLPPRCRVLASNAGLRGGLMLWRELRAPGPEIDKH